MSWKSFFYGSEETSKIKTLTHNIFFAATALTIYGLLSNFTPSQEWSQVGFHTALAMTALFTLTYCWNLKAGKIEHLQKKSLTAKALVVMILSASFLFITNTSITFGLGGITTQVLGHEKTIKVDLHANHQGGRRSCRYRLRLNPTEKLATSSICLFKLSHRPHYESGEYEAVAQQSVFGIHVIDPIKLSSR